MSQIQCKKKHIDYCFTSQAGILCYEISFDTVSRFWHFGNLTQLSSEVKNSKNYENVNFWEKKKQANLKKILQNLISGLTLEQTSLSPLSKGTIPSSGTGSGLWCHMCQGYTPKHILPPYTFQMPTGSLELIKILNHLCHGILYFRVCTSWQYRMILALPFQNI